MAPRQCDPLLLWTHTSSSLESQCSSLLWLHPSCYLSSPSTNLLHTSFATRTALKCSHAIFTSFFWKKIGILMKMVGYCNFVLSFPVLLSYKIRHLVWPLYKIWSPTLNFDFYSGNFRNIQMKDSQSSHVVEDTSSKWVWEVLRLSRIRGFIFTIIHGGSLVYRKRSKRRTKVGNKDAAVVVP